MKDSTFLRVMSGISFLYGLAAVLVFLSTVLMSLVASIVGSFFRDLMPLGPDTILQYFFFFLYMLIGGVMMIICAATGIRVIRGIREKELCLFCGVMTALAHVGIIYSSAPSTFLYIAALTAGLAIPLLYLLAAAMYIWKTGKYR